MRGQKQLLWVSMCMMVGLSVRASAVNESRNNRDTSVTPVAGESWIRHLHRPFGATSMGKTGRLGPPASPDGVQPAGWQLGFIPSPPETVQLHGEDLYRFEKIEKGGLAFGGFGELGEAAKDLVARGDESMDGVECTVFV